MTKTTDSARITESVWARAFRDLHDMRLPFVGRAGFIVWELASGLTPAAVGAVAPTEPHWYGRVGWALALGFVGAAVGVVALYVLMLPMALVLQRNEARVAAGYSGAAIRVHLLGTRMFLPLPQKGILGVLSDLFFLNDTPQTVLLRLQMRVTIDGATREITRAAASCLNGEPDYAGWRFSPDAHVPHLPTEIELKAFGGYARGHSEFALDTGFVGVSAIPSRDLIDGTTFEFVDVRTGEARVIEFPEPPEWVGESIAQGRKEQVAPRR